MSDRFYEVDWISELKERAEIVSIISSYIPLTKKGNTYWGNCPFHHEKTPSFAVNSRGQYYHCFGCNVSGDVIKFVAEFENVEFLDACKIIADKVGYKIPEFTKNPEIKQKADEKDEIYKVLQDTAVFYNKNLAKPEAKPALDYLAKRGLDWQIVTRFGLGASLDYDGLPTYLKLKNYSDDIILKSNVCGRNEKGQLYDALGGRLIIPIINVQGKVIAFGGRILEASHVPNKYKNTSNSAVFIKNKNLFGINLVSKLKQKQAVDSLIMVEGYMDVIALNKAGFMNVVASMGTSLTQGQAYLVKRFCDTVYVAYDGDSAGQNATLRSLDIFADQGLIVKVMELDKGLDPDEIVNQKGKQHFIDLMVNALPLIDYKLKKIGEKYDLTNLDARAKYASEAIRMLAEVKEPEVREVYLNEVCEKSQIQKHRLQLQLDNPKKDVLINVVTEKNKSSKKDSGYLKACRIVLYAMLNNKPYAPYVDIDRYLTDEVHKKILAFLKKNHEEQKLNVVGKLFDVVPESDELNEVISVGYDDNKKEYEKTEYEQSLTTMKTYYVEEEIKKLSEQIKTAVDVNVKKELYSKLKELQTEKKILSKGR